MSPPSVLILGANGRFGAAAVAAFANAGWEVVAQVRQQPESRRPDVKYVHTPLSNVDALAAMASGAIVVVYAVSPSYTDWSSELLPLAFRGIQIAERLGALLMLPGNVYVFGENMPSTLREDTPFHPTTEKGQLRCRLENEIEQRACSGRLRAVIIRAGDFYGLGTGSWLDLAVVKSLASGKLIYPGSIDVDHAWAYLPDLAKAFVRVAEDASEKKTGMIERLHFAGHTLTGSELLHLVELAAEELCLVPSVAKARGWKRGTMPWAAIRLMGLFSPKMKAIAEMSYLWRVPHRLDGAILKARYGDLGLTPAPLAIKSALANLRLGIGRGTSVKK